ncbi:accessory Sec system protein translocase subunit SecY2 [Weissella coleopterorum]|uniref:accessory Sec system protein translocase subunit SecY2 n=1 Tax=Weissella coleopterorum TaxID=2714949 RepID=UPI001FE9EED2|nr:accessory Sec system protein translocase subunit SecY2 [Weissella coleopterorum]
MILKNTYKRIAVKKVMFSMMVILIYLLGSNLVLPGIDAQALIQMINQTPNLAFSLSMTGLSLDRFSLLSIGLGPWMSALILWRVFTVTKIFNIDNLTNRQSYRLKFGFSLIIGTIQSISIIDQISLKPGSIMANKFWLILILLAGLSILIWLGNLNMQYGVGGATIIILISMIRSWPKKISDYLSVQHLDWQLMLQIIVFLILIYIFSFIIIYFFNGQIRLPLMHIMLNNKYAAQSYLPIPTNPAGGMPFMYSFSIMLLPQYLLFILKMMFKNNDLIMELYRDVQLDHPLGVGLLIVTIILLSYGFAYVNIDYQEIAKNLKKSGDYFLNVYPGKNTEKFLSDKIFVMATIGACFNALVIGVPMFIGIYNPGLISGHILYQRG